MTKLDDLTGRRFGKLLVISRHIRPDSRNAYWLCQCECGNTKAIAASTLRSTKSKRKGCGCGQWSTKHGFRPRNYAKAHPLYSVWNAILQRCNNPGCKFYERYGGRGIKVCERWKDFTNFIEDMGDRPGPGYSIDRIDNDGDYEPSNCRWATKKEQQNNMSSNRWFTIDGISMTMAQCCQAHGIKHTTVTGRLQRGWSTEDAFKRPAGSRKIP